MRALTLVYPFYLNAGMLLEHQRIWADLPDDVRAQIHVIVVDDGSPRHQAAGVWAPPSGLASARLYRIGVDVRWNWLACRNLGVAEASTEWVLLTDIDHVVPLETWRAILDGKLDPKAVYRFSRADAPHPWPWALADCRPYKVHPNTWMMTRGMFDKIGGYDERFSGFYGTDGEFRDRVHATARAIVMRPDVLVRYPREIIPDASTTTYQRKTPQDGENVSRIRAERPANARPLRGRFPWARVA